MNNIKKKNVHREDQKNSLHVAAENGFVDIVEASIEINFHINAMS